MTWSSGRSSAVCPWNCRLHWLAAAYCRGHPWFVGLIGSQWSRRRGLPHVLILLRLQGQRRGWHVHCEPGIQRNPTKRWVSKPAPWLIPIRKWQQYHNLSDWLSNKSIVSDSSDLLTQTMNIKGNVKWFCQMVKIEHQIDFTKPKKLLDWGSEQLPCGFLEDMLQEATRPRIPTDATAQRCGLVVLC